MCRSPTNNPPPHTPPNNNQPSTLNYPNTNQTTDHPKQWLAQIAEGLQALHEMKIIHCDLALRNILLTRDDEVNPCFYSVCGWIVFAPALNPPSPSLLPSIPLHKPTTPNNN